MKLTVLLSMLMLAVFPAHADNAIETETVATSEGDLIIHFVGHGTLMFTFKDMTIHIDPWSRVADYSKLPAGDLVLLTHNHLDHLDPSALKHAVGDNTTLIYTQQCADEYPDGVVMRNGMTWDVKGIHIEAVPAYCLIPRDDPRSQPHTQGECNGYILTFGDKRVYIVSETENIPELKEVKDIDIAFIAMDAIFNLTPEEAVGAVNAFRPKVIYPYHYADADLSPFINAFKNDSGVEVRVKDMRLR